MNKRYLGFLSDGGNILFPESTRRTDRFSKVYESLCAKLRAEGKPAPAIDLAFRAFDVLVNASQTRSVKQ